MPFAIGIENGKSGVNAGSLMRAAHNFGASLVFTIGRRYEPGITDTEKAWRNMPVMSFDHYESYRRAAPRDWIPIGVEIVEGAENLHTFTHPECAVYLLGPEDGSLSKRAQELCKSIIHVPTLSCMNVAVAGAIVMYDRCAKLRIT